MIGEIAKIQEANRYRIGSPKVRDELKDRGVEVGRNKVGRLMRDNGLNCRTKKGYQVTTKADGSKTPVPDLLRRNFLAAVPYKKWGEEEKGEAPVTLRPDERWRALPVSRGDITCVKTSLGWLYLRVVLDLFSRKVVGWSLSKSMDAGFVCEAQVLTFHSP